MKVRDFLSATNFSIWLTATLVTAGVFYVRSVGLSADVFHAAWSSFWIGAVVSLPLAAAISILRNRRVTGPVGSMLEMTNAMLSGKFRERFFPDTYTELDKLGGDLNKLATSLRAKMQDLRESNAKLEATLNASVSGIVIFNSEGEVSAVNQAAQDILGRPDAVVRGLSFTEALTSSDLVSLVFGALYHQTPKRQEIVVGRYRRVVDATAAPLLSEASPERPETLGVVLTMHDLTEIRRLERMRSDFVQNVSHELRTPVTVVKGFAETLRDASPDDPETVREMAGLIEAEASRLSSLVNSLLDLARLESGAIVPSRTPMDPRQVVTDTVRRLEPLSSRKRQSVSLRLETLAGSEFSADPSLMNMILTNLVENAMKYSGEGGSIEVGVKPDQGGWLFHVTDDGPGVSKEDLSRLFERFYRGSKDRSRSTGGSGLGLAVVKHSVTLLSGRVWAESEEGKGASFYVWLP